METKSLEALIKHADQLLTDARNELLRSEEDVIPYKVCFSARQSIVNYLSAYLIRNNIEIEFPVTIASLIEQCRSNDGRFDLINIDQISCNHDQSDEVYCTNLEKVSQCQEIAEQTRTICIAAAPPY